MSTQNIPFQSIDWEKIPKIEYKGESGLSYWQTIQVEGLRIRIVEYSNDFVLDHWCEMGHIVYCLEGEFLNELKDGETSTFKKGMSFVVSDKLSTHRISTKKGMKLLIIDGDFLKLNT